MAIKVRFTQLVIPILIAGVHAIPVAAQRSASVHDLNCTGVFLEESAQLAGRRVYQAYNAIGDGSVQFSGVIRSRTGEGRLYYGGYTNVGFEGRLDVTAGPYQGQQFVVSVLDNTGGNFIIYDGRPSLGAPEQWGRFACNWQQP